MDHILFKMREEYINSNGEGIAPVYIQKSDVERYAKDKRFDVLTRLIELNPEAKDELLALTTA
jgi:hypothetical protein